MLALLCVALWQTGYFILSFEEYDKFVIWLKPPGSHDQPAVVKSGLPINTVAKGSAATTGQFHELQPSSNKDKVSRNPVTQRAGMQVSCASPELSEGRTVLAGREGRNTACKEQPDKRETGKMIFPPR